MGCEWYENSLMQMSNGILVVINSVLLSKLMHANVKFIFGRLTSCKTFRIGKNSTGNHVFCLKSYIWAIKSRKSPLKRKLLVGTVFECRKER